VAAADKQETFYRPLGGGIEFGETAEEALRRELREELDVELGTARLIGVLENLFRFRGVPGHEIVFVFDAVVADPGFYSTRPPRDVLDEGSPVTWSR
jgi:ADP-ribose pyrophosphatase YjhB (NUDIX family)